MAVIGRKGSGKSALADILGLLGNSPHMAECSFLNDKKFRHSRLGKAKYFQASAALAGGDAVPAKCLNEAIDTAQTPRVKYIPQNYLEKICNDFMADSPFAAELKAVIFSHIKTADRLGCSSLDELLTAETAPILAKQASSFESLKAHNARVAALEERMSDQYKRAVIEAAAQKQQELDAHLRSKPAAENKPGEQEGATAAVAERITKVRERISSLQQKIEDAERELRLHKQRAASARRIEQQLSNVEAAHRVAVAAMANDLELLDIAAEDVVSLAITREPLRLQGEATKQAISDIEDKLNKDIAGSLQADLIAQKAALEAAQTELEGPAKVYQAYLTTLDEWEKQRVAIIGDSTRVGSLEYEKARAEEILQIPVHLKKAHRMQMAWTLRLYRATRQVASISRSLYSAVQEVVRSSPLVRERFQLNFDVAIAQEGLERQFFELVSQNKRGTFYGADAGRTQFKKLVDHADFESPKGVRQFIEDVVGALSADKREGDQPRSMADQLRSGRSTKDLYDLVYGLSYLKPLYKLTLRGRDLDQLSPGERGTLLLMFYLLVDRNDIPLVIDQPEENLDNQTVHELLVPCIRDAKARRQIIIVTHNPNLAVVCDAEQVIHAQLDPADGNRVTYTAGAIENQVINKLLIDVLEGTRPAFDNRDAKYFA